VAYVAALNAAVEREQARRDEEAQVAKQAAAEFLAPLENRLARVLLSIPVEIQRDQGLSLSSLRILLRGRQGGNCHCGELGEALRKLKFERRRSFGKYSGGSMLDGIAPAKCASQQYPLSERWGLADNSFLVCWPLDEVWNRVFSSRVLWKRKKVVTVVTRSEIREKQVVTQKGRNRPVTTEKSQ
jgi:hypothetical protein